MQSFKSHDYRRWGWHGSKKRLILNKNSKSTLNLQNTSFVLKNELVMKYLEENNIDYLFKENNNNDHALKNNYNSASSNSNNKSIKSILSKMGNNYWMSTMLLSAIILIIVSLILYFSV